jgi:hypothetical protein
MCCYAEDLNVGSKEISSRPKNWPVSSKRFEL